MIFDIRPIVHSIAKPFIERWHYSGCIPTGKNICYGLYVTEGGGRAALCRHRLWHWRQPLSGALPRRRVGAGDQAHV